MRRFELQRIEDKTGISGTGVIAQGVEFDDGACVMRWLTKFRSTGFYANMAELESIHGHGGSTKVVWLDPGLQVGIGAFNPRGLKDE